MKKKILIITNPRYFDRFKVPYDHTLRLLVENTTISLSEDKMSFVVCNNFEKGNIYVIHDNVNNNILENFGFSDVIVLYHLNGYDKWMNLDYSDYLQKIDDKKIGWHEMYGYYEDIYPILTDADNRKYERVLAYLNTIIP